MGELIVIGGDFEQLIHEVDQLDSNDLKWQVPFSVPMRVRDKLDPCHIFIQSVLK
jgi:hypothetical protein